MIFGNIKTPNPLKGAIEDPCMGFRGKNKKSCVITAFFVPDFAPAAPLPAGRRGLDFYKYFSFVDFFTSSRYCFIFCSSSFLTIRSTSSESTII
jgi:hypothetical protein